MDADKNCAQLTSDQIGSFKSAIVDWVGIAMYLQRRLYEAKSAMVRPGRDEALAPEIPRMQLAMGEVHFLSVSLRQINEHLNYLSPYLDGKMLAAANAYQGRYTGSELKSIRDVFEHRAKYLAGKGDFQEKIKEPGSLASFGGTARTKHESSLTIGSLGYKADISDLMQRVRQIKTSFTADDD